LVRSLRKRRAVQFLAFYKGFPGIKGEEIAIPE
jgi:hypothetical protein